jgi:hypothetical protein
MNINISKFSLALFFWALTFSVSVSALPAQLALERAADCLSDTHINEFKANPGLIAPGDSTKLSWQVSVPQGCGVSLFLNGVRVDASGVLAVTPTFPVNRYSLEGRMLGLRSALAKAPVTVNTDDCRESAVPTALLEPMLQNVLNVFDAGEAGIKQTRDAEIAMSPSNLAITMFFEVDQFGPNPMVRLAMRLTFNTVNGVVSPKFTYFHPQATSILPDDWIAATIYAKQEEILANFKSELNALLADPAFNLIDSEAEHLFSVETAEQAALTTICPLHRKV